MILLKSVNTIFYTNVFQIQNRGNQVEITKSPQTHPTATFNALKGFRKNP